MPGLASRTKKAQRAGHRPHATSCSHCMPPCRHRSGTAASDCCTRALAACRTSANSAAAAARTLRGAPQPAQPTIGWWLPAQQCPLACHRPHSCQEKTSLRRALAGGAAQQFVLAGGVAGGWYTQHGSHMLSGLLSACAPAVQNMHLDFSGKSYSRQLVQVLAA